MKVNKFIKSKIERDYFFVKGKIKIDVDYFIQGIEEGIQREDNQNFLTNLMSPMTSYTYFLQDKKFIETIMPLSDMITKHNFNRGMPWFLDDSWGFKQEFGNYTTYHDHLPSVVSGTIMLNKHPQKLLFPEIEEALEAEPGNFAIFTPFLLHGNTRNRSYKPRYGISFNWNVSSAYLSSEDNNLRKRLKSLKKREGEKE
tara:strand:+ start:52 stop:648 length:597 start_codon:yes stop_codon:yes gene_type:complete